MDVGGVLTDRFRQQRVDQADDGRIVALFEKVFGLRNGVRQRRQVHFVAQVLDHLPGAGGIAGVGRRQHLLELFLTDNAQQQLLPRVPLHFGQRGKPGLSLADQFHPVGTQVGIGDHGAEPPGEGERQAGRLDRRRACVFLELVLGEIAHRRIV